MKFLITTLFLSLLSAPYADSIYELSFKTIAGETVPVSRFKGHKVLFVVLPLSPTDTILPASALKAIQTKYTSLIIVGIVSEEVGFKKADKEKIKKQYRNMLPGFLLTEPLKATKASGKDQNPVLQWLTHRKRNTHFDEDAKSPGYKYFIDEKGELYGMLDPKVKISGAFVDRVIRRN